MSTQELPAAINNLRPGERLALLESLVRSLREDLNKSERAAIPVGKIRGIAKSAGTPLTERK